MYVLIPLMQSMAILLAGILFAYWVAIMFEICKAAFENYDAPQTPQPMRFQHTLGNRYLGVTN